MILMQTILIVCYVISGSLYQAMLLVYNILPYKFLHIIFFLLIDEVSSQTKNTSSVESVPGAEPCLYIAAAAATALGSYAAAATPGAPAPVINKHNLIRNTSINNSRA